MDMKSMLLLVTFILARTLTSRDIWSARLVGGWALHQRALKPLER